MTYIFFLLFIFSTAITENPSKKTSIEEGFIQNKIVFDTLNYEGKEPNNIFSEQIFCLNGESEETKDSLSGSQAYSNNTFHAFKAKKIISHSQAPKLWTFFVYISADNDLYKYALRNIEQLQQIGSNENINILISIDSHVKGKVKETRRFYVEKNNLLQIGNIPAQDSGDPQNLIDAAAWALKQYPSKYFGIVLWNHGTGPFDPEFVRQQIKPNEFFYYNKENKKISINKNIEFSEFITSSGDARGICFDDTTRNYLTTKKLAIAFQEIYKLRNNEKIDIVMMDACLMAGIEIAFLCSKYAKILTASEEVVLGPGYNYASTFKILSKEKITPYNFAIHIVKTYHQTYNPIANDFTQSAINLLAVEEFCQYFAEFIEIINKYRQYDKKDHIKKSLKLAASKEMVTHFCEPSFIDLKDFLENALVLLLKIPKNTITENKESHFLKDIKEIINKLLQFYNKMIIANSHGQHAQKASGLFIYFPLRTVDQTYMTNDFTIKTKWGLLLQALK